MVEDISSERTSSRKGVPLCVDLDGTLVNTDLLGEALLTLFKKNPLYAAVIPFWLLEGKARFKRRIAGLVSVPAAQLPYNAEFLDFLKGEHKAGRILVLATATDERFAEPVARHLGLFSEVLASDGVTNLSGAGKLLALQRRFPDGFDYAGDSKADLPVWREARECIMVRPSASALSALSSERRVNRVFQSSKGLWSELWRAIRPHQWAKNALIFLPLVTSHQILLADHFLKTLIAAAAFSLCASSVYLLNDLLDLAADRNHRTKKARPFASGALPLAYGPVLTFGFLAAAVALAAFLPRPFWIVLGTYYMTTLAYSLRLKGMLLVDVFCLAALYTLRILAGHAVTDIPFSQWLLAFSMFLFLSLAMMKRYTELRLSQEPAFGRCYVAADATGLMVMGTASGYLAALIFALYINSDQVAKLYSRPMFLWLICFIILHGISRIWLLAQRGEVADDPVLFVCKDKASYVSTAAAAAILIAASWR